MSNKHITKVLHPETHGSIIDVYKSMYTYDKIIKNDGDKTFKHLSKAPIQGAQNDIPSSVDIEVAFTDTQLDNIAFHDSFVSVVLRPTLNFQNWKTANAETLENFRHIYDSIYQFVGFKASIQSIAERRFKHQGSDVSGTQNNTCIIESYLDNIYKPHSEKTNRKFTYSLYDDVHNYTGFIAGVYIPISKIHDGNGIVTVEIPLNIPFDDFPELQAFRDYPQFAYGELRGLLRFSGEAFVFAQVDPMMSMRKDFFNKGYDYDFQDYETTVIQYVHPDSIDNPNIKNSFTAFTELPRHSLKVNGMRTSGPFELVDPGSYDRGFFQINTQGTVIYDIQLSKQHQIIGFKYCKILPTIMDMKTKTITTELDGYGLSDFGKMEGFKHFMEHPFIVPAQRVKIENLGGTPNAGGLKVSANIPFNHVTDMILLFPKYAAQVTCFENPMLNNITLKTFGRNFPDKAIDVSDSRFYQLMINASDLDSLFSPTSEYTNSLIVPRANAQTRLRPTTDLTSFAITLQVERSGGAGIFFDGLDSNGASTSVELSASPIYQGNNDTYYIPDISEPNRYNTAAPILCLVSDTFWVFKLQNSSINPISCEYFTKLSLEEAQQLGKI